MKKLICPDCGEISTVYVPCGGIIMGRDIPGLKNNSYYLLQTCAGENGEDIYLPIIEEDGFIKRDPPWIRHIINSVSDEGECIDCGRERPIREYLKNE